MATKSFVLISLFLLSPVLVQGTLTPLSQHTSLIEGLVRNVSSTSVSVPSTRYQVNYSEPCGSHLSLYEDSLKGREEWALKMFDASTKIPEGILNYALMSLGNFDECIDLRDIDNITAGTFNGKYCLTFLVLDSSIGMAGTAALTTATCLPSTCSADDATLYVNLALQKLKQIAALINGSSITDMVLGAAITEQGCSTKDEPELEPKDWAAVGILIFFGVLVVLSTCYDIFKKDGRSNILLAFSLATNGKKLLAISSSAETLNALHGIRFLSIAWVMLGHRYAISPYLPSQNAVKFQKDLIQHWQNVGLTNATLSVDTFFLLSGLLVSYVFFKQIHKTKHFNIPMFYIHRYLRLTPALAIMILLEATLLRYSGSGPLWKMFSAQLDTCQDNWWQPLLYIQNYVEPLKMCIAQSWYLAVDMQLHWLSPLVLIPLWKWPRIASIFMALLSLGGLIATYFIAYDNKFPASYVMLSTTETNTFMKELYYPVYTRFIPYIIGVGVGYLLVEAKRENMVRHFSVLLTLGLWLVSASLMLIALMTVQVFQDPGYEFEPVGAAIYITLHRPIWALGLAIMIYLCCTGHGGYVNGFLSWNAFQPLSRLSYCLYLTHMVVQMTQYGSVKTVGYTSGSVLIQQYFADVIRAIFWSAALSLVFESPFIALENELLGKKKAPSQPKATVSENPGNLQRAA